MLFVFLVLMSSLEIFTARKAFFQRPSQQPHRWKLWKQKQTLFYLSRSQSWVAGRARWAWGSRLTSDFILGGVQSMPLALVRTGWTYKWFNKMLTNTFIEGLFCARHLLAITTLWSTGKSLFSSWGIWGLEKLRNVCKVTQLIGVQIQSQTAEPNQLTFVPSLSEEFTCPFLVLLWCARGFPGHSCTHLAYISL